ncbi:uncharacterized protein LOC133180255 [Saccostrea echinata]|uniref:uncharacterized protein LOC133180255 n=1 Tax=Saccostrea echinata TaxID=191078 RepID=UPI002A81F438|nr:uncharacterized protein LOC133180255 [Saccostrea echinata]
MWFLMMLMLLTLTEHGESKMFIIDSVQCTPSSGGLLGCDWKGPGDYVGSSVDFDTLIFRRLFSSGFVNIFNSPGLRIVEIQSGDASCGNINVPEHVKVFIKAKLCNEDLSSSSPSALGSPKSSGESLLTSTSSSSSSPSEKRTTMTFDFSTTDQAYPHIQIFWERISTLQIAVIILSVLSIAVCTFPKPRPLPPPSQTDSASQTTTNPRVVQPISPIQTTTHVPCSNNRPAQPSPPIPTTSTQVRHPRNIPPSFPIGIPTRRRSERLRIRQVNVI